MWAPAKATAFWSLCVLLSLSVAIPCHTSLPSAPPVDVAQRYADEALAQELLGWRAKHTLADMCTDAWRWQSNNPDGYV
jgi:UDP-glucose 4-epimerase